MTKTNPFAALLLTGLFASGAAAQDINPAINPAINPETLIAVTNVDPRETGRNDPALLLAQGLIAEAGWTLHDDHRAIPWVLARRATLPAFRRAERPEIAALLGYVSAFKCYGRNCDTERMQRMRSLTWALIDARAPGIARIARAWVRGERHTDPCPAAWHWGSHVDSQNSPLAIVTCGRTTNRFLGKPVRAVLAPLREPGRTVSASAVRAGLRRRQ
jgi:hypothetical protein